MHAWSLSCVFWEQIFGMHCGISAFRHFGIFGGRSFKRFCLSANFALTRHVFFFVFLLPIANTLGGHAQVHVHHCHRPDSCLIDKCWMVMIVDVRGTSVVDPIYKLAQILVAMVVVWLIAGVLVFKYMQIE